MDWDPAWNVDKSMTMAGDVVCPSDTAVTEFWRLEMFFFFFALLPRCLSWYAVLGEASIANFFVVVAGGLVGVHKHLVEVVSLV